MIPCLSSLYSRLSSFFLLSYLSNIYYYTDMQLKFHSIFMLFWLLLPPSHCRVRSCSFSLWCIPCISQWRHWVPQRLTGFKGSSQLQTKQAKIKKGSLGDFSNWNYNQAWKLTIQRQQLGAKEGPGGGGRPGLLFWEGSEEPLCSYTNQSKW